MSEVAATETVVKSTPKSKGGETDLLITIAQEAENLTKVKAFKQARELIRDEGVGSFKLGAILATIQTHSWWQDTHGSFKDFIIEEMALPYRKALYLIEVYNALITSEITWDRVKDLGWTKLKTIASVLTKENAEEWVARAEQSTVLQLEDMVKAAKKGEATPSNTAGAATSDTTTMTFKLHSDQKDLVREALDRIKESTGTEHDAVALERMAQQSLEGSAGKPVVADLKTVMKGKTPEEILETFSELYPNFDITVTETEDAVTVNAEAGEDEGEDD